jgi:hypothetical protein
MGARISSGNHLGDSPLATELPTSLSRAPSGQFDFDDMSQSYDDVRRAFAKRAAL